MKKTLAAATLAAALAACSGGQTDTLTVGLTYVPDTQFFPFYVAAEEGYFEDAGIEVEIRHHGAQEALFTALTTAKEDVVYAGADELVVARADSLEAYSFATLYQDYPLTLIVHASSDIDSPADLAGRTLGIPGEFGSNYYAMLAMMEEYDLQDVEVRSIGYTQVAALTRGDVDAVIGFVNNDAIAMESQGLDVRTIDLAPEVPLVSVGLITTEASAARYGEDFPALIDALDRAVTFAIENPEEALDDVYKHVPTLTDADRDSAMATMVATIELYRAGEFGAQDPQRWAAMVDFLVASGVIESAPPGDLFVDAP